MTVLQTIKIYSENSTGVPVYYDIMTGDEYGFKYVLTQPIHKMVMRVPRIDEVTKQRLGYEEVEITKEECIEHIKLQKECFKNG